MRAHRNWIGIPVALGLAWISLALLLVGASRAASPDEAANSTNTEVTLAISRVQASNPQYQSYTTIQVSSGELSGGDEVTLCFANARAPHKSYQAIDWQTLTDADGDGQFAPLPTLPRMNITPDPTPNLMVASGPTYVEAGVPFTLTVRALDEYSNPCPDFADTLTFSSTDTAADPPAPSPFLPGSGVHEFRITLHTPGIQYVFVDGAGLLQTNSNPLVVVQSSAAQPQLFWGDLHGHHSHIYISQGQRASDNRFTLLVHSERST